MLGAKRGAPKTIFCARRPTLSRAVPESAARSSVVDWAWVDAKKLAEHNAIASRGFVNWENCIIKSLFAKTGMVIALKIVDKELFRSARWSVDKNS